MPKGLKRYHESGQTHFITFSCYHRRVLLGTAEAARVFESALESVRRAYRMCVYGYVVMPDHIHLLVSEPERSSLSEAIKALKQSVFRRMPQQDGRFWQTRYYDFNIRAEQKRIEKLRYLHRNPVRAKLCPKPEDWPWSSFAHYATGVRGVVEIESDWTAARRQRNLEAST